MASSRALLLLLIIALPACGGGPAPSAITPSAQDPGLAPPRPDASVDEDATATGFEGANGDARDTVNGDAGTNARADVGAPDAQPPANDASVPDACVPGAPDTSATPPTTLSATGLYQEMASRSLASGVEAYRPRYPLWTDAAEKTRFIALPSCTTIDTSDMDHWSIPVGTRLWKEFDVGGKRIETRFIQRFGPGPDDFVYAAYAWNDDESDARFVPEGVTNARGTQHDIPAQMTCLSCHNRASEHVLGFSAIQLSHEGPGPTMASLSNAGKLTVPAPRGFSPPGDAVAREALGYLHANCGHCHNDGARAIRPPTPFVLQLSTGDVRIEETGVMRTAVDVPLSWFYHPGINRRISAGSPNSSAISYRMSMRGSWEQMPPIGSERVDTAGLASVRAFIESL